MFLYEVESSDGALSTTFAEVLLFFTDEEHQQQLLCTCYLAYILEILVECNGRRIYQAEFGLKKVIKTKDISELIGLSKITIASM